MIKKWNVLGSRYVYKSQRLAVRQDTLKMPNGRTTDYEILEYPDFVGIIAITDDKKIIFVKQYRPAVKKITIEVPAGFIDKGESPEKAALRELEEETGYHASRVRKIGVYHSLVGRSDSVTHLFFASGLKKTQHNMDEDEFLEVIKLDAKRALRLVEKGKIKAAPSVAGIYGISALGLV